MRCNKNSICATSAACVRHMCNTANAADEVRPAGINCIRIATNHPIVHSDSLPESVSSLSMPPISTLRLFVRHRRPDQRPGPCFHFRHYNGHPTAVPGGGNTGQSTASHIRPIWLLHSTCRSAPWHVTNVRGELSWGKHFVNLIVIRRAYIHSEYPWANPARNVAFARSRRAATWRIRVCWDLTAQYWPVYHS